VKNIIHGKANDKTTNPAAERTGYGCFGKVFVSEYIPFISPQKGGVVPFASNQVMRNFECPT
jgi:hypothetical protein